MKDQKTLKEIYKKDMEGYWIRRNGEVDNKMVNYLIKKVAYIVELENNSYYVIDKPDIEKDFCFGYGYCGVSDEEDYRQAADMAAHARTNENYFIRKNMEPLEKFIEDIKDDSYQIYKRPHYFRQQADCQLVDLDWCQPWDKIPEGHEQLTGAEKNAILYGVEVVKEQFKKRLNTYLKRYGLTKVHSWTYLSD